MRKTGFALFLVGSTIAVPALAQEGTNPLFTGPRVEATIGYDNVRAGSSVNTNQNNDGFMYGGGVGYDFAAGGALIGVEGELTGSTARSSRRPFDGNFGFGRVSTGRDWYAGARVGFLATPTTLIYAKGGYTNMRLNVLAGNTNTTTDTNFNLGGYRVGAGAEHAIGRNTYAKVEYRYSNYQRGNIDYAAGGTSGRFDVDTDRHQVTASYGIRF